MSRYLSLHAEAAAWRQRATTRFPTNISSSVSTIDGLHLEHSPAYHVLITYLLGHLISELGMSDDRLNEMHRTLTATTSWLVMPDGSLPQLGDTSLVAAPQLAVENEAAHRGFAVFYDAGAAIYRDVESYFMTVAWYHRLLHKHADDLSFVWAEGGRRLVVDSGKYGYDYGESGYAYGVSSPAHNTLTLFPPYLFEAFIEAISGLLNSCSVPCSAREFGARQL